MLRYKSEVGQQKILFRGSFGTQKPGGARSNAFDIFMKNAANTNVIHWRGRLLALFESAQPIAMDPYSLKTLGPELLGGSVKAGASFDFGPANGMAGIPFATPKLAWQGHFMSSSQTACGQCSLLLCNSMQPGQYFRPGNGLAWMASSSPVVIACTCSRLLASFSVACHHAYGVCLAVLAVLLCVLQQKLQAVLLCVLVFLVHTESFFKAVGVAGYKHGGEYRLGGEAVTAHPRFDPDTGALQVQIPVVPS